MAMWRYASIFLICACWNLWGVSPSFSQVAQEGPGSQQVSQSKIKDGYFEITLDTPSERKIIAEELVRDRDLNPAALFRVSSGGYLSFDDQDWVKDINFKIYEVPVTELPHYKRFAQLLQEINDHLGSLNHAFRAYDQVALRLVNHRPGFNDVESTDDIIKEYLTSYLKLVRLKQLIVHSLDRFVKERSVVTQFGEYNRILDRYRDELDRITRTDESLMRRGQSLSQSVKAGQDSGADSVPYKGRK
jgi:hypothetical protein